MADLPDPDDIAKLVTALAPGLLILGIRSSVRREPAKPLAENALIYAAISSAYYAVAIPIFRWSGGVEIQPALWQILHYFLVPCAIGLLAAYEAQRNWLYRIARRFKLYLTHPVPAAWDYAFGELREGTFLFVTLNGGDTVAGLMGGMSFASSSKEERDLLLEEIWEIDAQGVWAQLTPKRGILLCGKDIKHVEIFGG